jgi:hypothetical protein
MTSRGTARGDGRRALSKPPAAGARARAAATASVTLLLVAGCTSSGHRAPASSTAHDTAAAGTVATAQAGAHASGRGKVRLDGLTAVTPGSAATLTATAADVTPAGTAQLTYFAKRFGSHVAAPIELRSSTPLPRRGAILSRRYPSPLPRTVTATFLYFDTSIGGWRTVASYLSSDRRTVTAPVHHFSTWTTVTTTVGGWVQGAGNGVTWTLGSMFDTRVAAPTCEGKVPSWVKDTVFLDGLNTPLRWCVGHDPQHADWVVVKVRVNRGYGATVETTTDPQWSWNSFLDRSGVSIAAHVLTDYSAEAAKYASVLLQPGAQLIPGGEEVDFGFTEAQVRAARGGGVSLVSVSQPTLVDLALDLIIQQMADQIGNKKLAYLVGLLTVLRCGGDIVRAGANPAALAGAISGCVGDAKDIIGQQLAQYAQKDLSLSPKEAAKAGLDASKKLLLVAAAGVTFQLVSDLEDLHLDSAARAASVFPTIAKPPTCVTSAQLAAALPAAKKKLLATKYGRLGHGVDVIRCVGDWAGAGVDFYSPGSCCGPDGGPMSNTETVALHWVGSWKVVDRQPPCDAGEIPKAIYELVCMSN